LGGTSTLLALAAPIIAVAFSAALYWIGGLLRTKLKEEGAKLAAYACGESPTRYPLMKVRLRVLLYNVAVAFAVIDSAGIVLALAIGIQPHTALLVACYSVVVLLALLLVPVR